MRRLSNIVLRSLLPLILVGLLFSAAAALDPSLKISQFHHKSWSARDGAPGQVIALAQTQDGLLWLGTQTGLFRFDGLEFERFQPIGGEFLSPNIYSLLATADGGLWIGYWNGGAGFVKDETLTNYQETEGLPARGIRRFAQDHDGRIWAATGAGLYYLDNGLWKQNADESGLPDQNIQTLYIDAEGNTWGVAGNALLTRPIGSTVFQTVENEIGSTTKITKDKNGSVWLSEVTRSVRQITSSGTDDRRSTSEIKVGANRILFDRDGSLWVATLGDGIRRVAAMSSLEGKTVERFGPETESFTTKDGLSSDHVYTAIEDRQGNIWFGTENGLERFRSVPLITLALPEGFQSFGMAPASDGSIWIVSHNGYMLRIVDDQLLEAGTVPSEIATVVPASSGGLWLSYLRSNHSLMRVFDLGSKLLYASFPLDRAEGRARSLLTDSKGVPWAWFEPNGFYRLENESWIEFARPELLPSELAISSVIDVDGKMWAGHVNNTVSRIDGESVSIFRTENGVNVGNIHAIAATEKNIWIGGHLGLAFFDGERFRTVVDAAGDSIAEITGIVVSNGDVWLNAGKGVIQIPSDEVTAVLAEPDRRVNIRVFDALDGLRGGMQRQQPYPTAIKDAKDVLYFSTRAGVVRLDPKKIKDNDVPPPVTIRSLTAGGSGYHPTRPIVLPKGTNDLQITFAALDLGLPERVRYRYRLAGSNNEWVDAGTRRDAFFSNLGPGNFRFELLAANGDGLWATDPAVLQFQILPLFYQTYWFIGLCSVAVVFATWLFYRWRIRQIEARISSHYLERLSERRRIAQDLHDDLLQGFVSSSIQLNVVAENLPYDSPVRKSLTNIETQLRTIVDKGREKVSNLRTSFDRNDVYLDETLNDAMSEIKGSYAGEVTILIEGERRFLNPTIHDTVYYILREAIINAIKHAKAKNIEVTLAFRKKDVVLTVRDDGKGIEDDIIRSGKTGHWGMKMMRERADEIGAKFKIWTLPSHGSQVEVTVPGRVAYD